jgi:hypothetical protein
MLVLLMVDEMPTTWHVPVDIQMMAGNIARYTYVIDVPWAMTVKKAWLDNGVFLTGVVMLERSVQAGEQLTLQVLGPS